MHPLLRAATVLVPLALSGCGMMISVPTNPDNYSIDPKAVAQLRAPQSVALENAYPVELPAAMPMRNNTLVVEQQKLTETAIVMLSRALEKQGIAVSPQGDKTITLRVRAQGYRMQMFRWTGQVILETKLGDGTIISYPNESLSPKGWENAFDGAVLFALNDLLSDDRFVAYVNSTRADPPKPSSLAPVAPSPAVAPALAGAASLAAPTAASLANRRLPQVGDTRTHSQTRVEYLKKEPPAGSLSYGRVVYVDDGTCPQGEVKEITGGNRQQSILRKVRCVKRPS